MFFLDLLSHRLEAVHTVALDPSAFFGKIIRYMPQLDIQDRERDNPHRAGPENPWPRPITSTVYAKSHVWNSA